MKPSCLICAGEVTPSGGSGGKLEKSESSRKEPDSGNNLLERQLRVIFLLKELLQVPGDKLEGYFTKCGMEGNPEDWIKLCGECVKSVDEARTIFLQIVELNRKLAAVREQVVTTIKTTSGEAGQKLRVSPRRGRWETGSNKKLTVEEDVRQFVNECGYTTIQQPDQTEVAQASKLIVLRCLTPNSDADLPYASIVVKQELPFDDNLVDVDDNLDSAYSPEEAENSEPEVVNEVPADKVPDSKPSQPILALTDPISKRGKRRSLNEAGAILVNGKIHYKCTVPNCERVLVSRRNYLRHKRTVHSGKPKQKMRVEDQEGAFKNAEGTISFRCVYPGCGKVLKSRECYRIHKKHVHLRVPHRKREEKPRQCTECGEVFPTYVQFARHRRKVHEGRPRYSEQELEKNRALYRKSFVQCPYCEYYASRVNVTAHIKMKHELNFPKTCPVCELGLRDTNSLRRHLADKHGVCPEEECKDKPSFPNRKELRQHQISEHGKELDAFGCQECGEVFMKRQFLKRHLKIHEQDKQGGKEAGEYVCDLCGKQFALQDYLYFHKWSTHKVNKGKRKREDELGSGENNNAVV